MYDGPGGAGIIAQGSNATLTLPGQSLVVSKFGKITANQQGTNQDTVQQAAINYALTLNGNWTSHVTVGGCRGYVKSNACRRLPACF